MKLIFAVIRDKDANDAVDELIRRRIGVTKLSSTGGFLRDGNTTLMIGTEDDRVEEVMQALQSTCAKRSQVEVVAPHSTGGVPVWNMSYAPVKIEVGGATVFVLDVEQFQTLCAGAPAPAGALFVPKGKVPPGGGPFFAKRG